MEDSGSITHEILNKGCRECRIYDCNNEFGSSYDEPNPIDLGTCTCDKTEITTSILKLPEDMFKFEIKTDKILGRSVTSSSTTSFECRASLDVDGMEVVYLEPLFDFIQLVDKSQNDLILRIKQEVVKSSKSKIPTDFEEKFGKETMDIENRLIAKLRDGFSRNKKDFQTIITFVGKMYVNYKYRSLFPKEQKDNPHVSKRKKRE